MMPHIDARRNVRVGVRQLGRVGPPASSEVHRIISVNLALSQWIGDVRG